MASERSCKWYSPESVTPVYEVEGSKSTATHKVMVTPSLLYARKLRLLPSVTSVIKEIASYGLEKWKETQLIMACIKYPLTQTLDGLQANEVEAVIEKYAELVRAKAGEFAAACADRGTLIHADIQKSFEGKQTSGDPAAERAVSIIADKFSELGVVEVSTEVSFGSVTLGYAGTPDLDCRLSDGTEIMFDMKTTDLKKFKKPHDSWYLQGGAYRRAKRDVPGTRFEQIVIDRDSGDAIFVPHEDPEQWEIAWDHLFNLWCILKQYDPRRVVA